MSNADVWILIEALLRIDPDVGQPSLAKLVLEFFEVSPAVVVVKEGVRQGLVDGVTLVVMDNQTVLSQPQGENKKKGK